MRTTACLVAAALGLAGTAAAAPAPVTAFVHVNVVPMDRERVLRDQTVVVEGDHIVAVGPNALVPRGAQVIDGHGSAWLSPGLADMHTHSDTKQDLAVYLANGVTSVLNMGGARASFIDRIVPASNGGKIPGPHIYMSFIVDSTPEYGDLLIKTPEQARAFVGLAKANGYDFIKVYNNLYPEVFDALVEEGRRQHVPVVGHGVTRVGLARQLAEGQVMVAHAEEFFYTVFTPPGVEQTDTPPADDRIPGAIALVKRYGAAVTADPVTYGAIARQIGHKDVIDGWLAAPETRYLSPKDRLGWRLDIYVDKTAKLMPKYAFEKRFLKAMADADVTLITGTDAPAVPGMRPGFSLHDDLDDLESAGLTRFQVLSAATREPGEFIVRTIGGQPFGVVAVGDRADLILSQANPLDGLATLKAPIGVMAHGQWRDAAALQALLDGVAAQYRSVTTDLDRPAAR